MATLPRVVAAARRRVAAAVLRLAAFAMWVFALGPEPTFFGLRALYQAPYGWLMRLPGFDGLRVPARFWMMALACLSVMAALAINRLEGGRARRGLVASPPPDWCSTAGRATSSSRAAPERAAGAAGRRRAARSAGDRDRDAAALYQQTIDGVPLHNGFSGYFAPHYYALRELLEANDPRILQALAARGPLGVVIDHEADNDGAIRKFVSAYPGAPLHESHADWSSYRCRRTAAVDSAARSRRDAARDQVARHVSKPAACAARAGRRPARRGGAAACSSVRGGLTIELENPAHVGQVVIDLGEFSTDFPMRLHIDVSADGATWETACTGDTALHAYYAAHAPSRGGAAGVSGRIGTASASSG